MSSARALWASLSAGLLLSAGAARAEPPAKPQTPRALAITFDDLPATGPDMDSESRLQVIGKIIAALKAAGVPPVYGFVNGSTATPGPDEDDASVAQVLSAWRAAGYPLGSHTWSHIDLDESSEEAFEAEVTRNEPVLRRHMRFRDWRWFRYPYLSVGATPQAQAAARGFLHRRGYRIAAVTMDFHDYAYDDAYARCMARGDQDAVLRIEQAYMDAAGQAVDYSRTVSMGAVGREIPYVLLMHVGHIDAEMLPRLLDLYRARGFTFITLKEAEKDPFYRPDTDLGSPAATDNLAEAMDDHGLDVPPDPDDPAWLDTICQ